MQILLIKERRTLPRVRELKRWISISIDPKLSRTLPRVRELKLILDYRWSYRIGRTLPRERELKLHRRSPVRHRASLSHPSQGA